MMQRNNWFENYIQKCYASSANFGKAGRYLKT